MEHVKSLHGGVFSRPKMPYLFFFKLKWHIHFYVCVCLQIREWNINKLETFEDALFEGSKTSPHKTEKKTWRWLTPMRKTVCGKGHRLVIFEWIMSWWWAEDELMMIGWLTDDEKMIKRIMKGWWAEGHSGQIGNMRHSGTLKTQNCQYEKLWKYYWLFSCSYHTRWEKNNGQAYLTHRVHVVRVFENLMSRNDEMKVWSSPGLETHLFLSHVDCISSIMMKQIKKYFFLQFLTYVPS